MLPETLATAGRQMSQRQKTSVRGKLAKRCRTRADLEEHCFCPHLAKKLQTAAEKGSLNRPIPLLIFINCDPLSDHSKSKAQTTKVQQPRPCLQIPFAKLNYFAKKEKEKKKKDISFSSLPDGKSASRKKMYKTPAEKSEKRKERKNIFILA